MVRYVVLFCVVALWCGSGLTPAFAQGVLDGFLLAPAPVADFMASTEESDQFDACPTYPVSDVRQCTWYNGWGGPEDFSANVRVAWNGDNIFWRIDIADDILSVSKGPDTGDRIVIRMAYHTCGPVKARARGERPFDVITLYPNPAKDRCRVVLDTTSKARFGELESRLFRTIDGYAILLAMPVGDWEDPPRLGATARIQVSFVDADDRDQPAVAHHRFVLFPTRRTAAPAETNVRFFGKIKFVGDRWVRISPAGVVFDGGVIDLRLTYGNLSKEDLEAQVVVKNRDTGKTVKDAGVTKRLKAGTHEVSVPLRVDLGTLPKGKYELRARVDVYFDTGYINVQYAGGISLCPDLIERRRKKTPRSLAILADEAGVRRSYRYIAGGGTVLWSAGKYDASSNEFPQRIRRMGPHEVAIPGAKATDIPWALFGGQDNLDKMAEPLVLKLAPDFGAKVPPFTPDEFAYGEDKYKRRQAIRSRRLLLLGVHFDYTNEDSVPDVLISTPAKTLLHQRLVPTATAGIGARHSYLLRAWLENSDREIRIENATTHGPRMEIDCLAIMGGGAARTGFGDGDSAIVFGGAPTADLFNRQMATALFFMANYLVDKDGRAYSSLPGGSYDRFDPQDYGQLMAELSVWNQLSAAQALGAHAAKHMDFSRYGGGDRPFNLGHAAIISGLYHLWRKLGQPPQLLRRDVWLNAVHRPLTRLSRQIATHPLHLVDSGGGQGVDGDRPGATLPMYFATQAAVRQAAIMARGIGYGDAAAVWENNAKHYAAAFRAHLVSPEAQIRIADQTVYPESWGLPAQSVIALLPQNVWVYGRYDDGDPVLYNAGIRVFDTPYLLSGTGALVDAAGFTLDAADRDQLQASYNYIQNFSPIFTRKSWHHFLIDYNSSVLQLWMIQAALLLDNTQQASDMLRAYVKYTYDENLPLGDAPGMRADIEVSPFTFEERLHVGKDGEVLAPGGDELNVQNAVNALRTARLIAGIDDHDPAQLHLRPRLPAAWNSVRAQNWLVAHDFEESKVGPVQYAYERLSDRRYSMTLVSPQPLRSVEVRIGPFDAKVRRIRVTTGNSGENLTAQRDGAFSWAVKTFRDVSDLRVTAQASVY